jgi:hypothetical protein
VTLNEPSPARGQDRCRPPHQAGQTGGVPLCRNGNYRQTTIVDMAWTEGHGAAVRIGEPARKHGVSDADIWHAVRIAIRKIDLNGEDPVVIHAMRLRPKFYPLIRQG